jgi:methanogenic corrinoid protein MtbC1
MTVTTDQTHSPQAWPCDTSVRSSDLAGLARGALARLCAEMQGGTNPHLAQQVLGDPCAAAMAYALCDVDDMAASVLVEDLLEAGLSVEDVCLDHLAPAARHLGDLWDRDRLPFTEVALATARIQALLRRMPPGRVTPSCGRGKGAVFAAVPGEQHTLGVMMAADLFRRNGWDVGLMVGLGHDELVNRIARDDRPVIGLSCSSSQSYPALRRLVAALGRMRPSAQILLSGHVVRDAARVADLPAPVVIVPDITAAEAEMLRIETSLSAPRGRQSQRRSSSAA